MRVEIKNDEIFRGIHIAATIGKKEYSIGFSFLFILSSISMIVLTSMPGNRLVIFGVKCLIAYMQVIVDGIRNNTEMDTMTMLIAYNTLRNIVTF